MGTLVTILGTGKGTWVEVHSLLQLNAFDNVILFIDEWAAKEYKNEFKTTVVPMPETGLDQLVDFMKQHIKKEQHAAEFDIAINIASGTGKQHAALLSALLQLGYGIRLVGFEQGQLKVLS
jgi:hypothetical protein